MNGTWTFQAERWNNPCRELIRQRKPLQNYSTRRRKNMRSLKINRQCIASTKDSGGLCYQSRHSYRRVFECIFRWSCGSGSQLRRIRLPLGRGEFHLHGLSRESLRLTFSVLADAAWAQARYHDCSCSPRQRWVLYLELNDRVLTRCEVV